MVVELGGIASGPAIWAGVGGTLRPAQPSSLAIGGCTLQALKFPFQVNKPTAAVSGYIRLGEGLNGINCYLRSFLDLKVCVLHAGEGEARA